MTIILTSSPNDFYDMTKDGDTLVIAPNVIFGFVMNNYQDARIVNYGNMLNTSPHPAVWFTNGGGIFINEVEGVVTTEQTHPGFPAVRLSGAPPATVINKGIMLSNSHGISVTDNANNDSIVNSGHIYGLLNGIFVGATGATNVTISNSGEIWGDANGIHVAFAVGAAPVIVNSGVIGGRANAIVASDGDRLNVTNTGTLQGNVVGVSVDQSDSVVNNGKIIGYVGLGYGADSYRGTGTVTGVILGEDGNDSLSGGASVDRLFGGKGNDTLMGNGGNDIMNGHADNDRIFGGLGVDTLTGAEGKDTFVFDTAPSSSNRDVITDFSHLDDTIQLENAIFKSMGSGVLLSKYFYAGTKAHDADDHVIYNKATGALYYDSDGTGAHAQVQFATISNHATAGLAYNDFLLV